ncbi:hypothetical protein Pla110_07980 [Polystyrenella longa]|uniref:SGNH hydrolase-type esterase domain-containing protein n=1 Tax=Polystyrenella longa TaxID=2528007 RepID=A0A518CIT3_9PLAN|nr:SGNH/GDSL hydrolase family protein [Polystyrenella longa]QDU79094.1 hypothetical protein Pla110_07980 [Polystyrenella longa]
MKLHSVVTLSLVFGMAVMGIHSVSQGEDKETDQPQVLILGDSISIGYTPTVKELLKEEAVVTRPMKNEEKAENCAGTTNGVKHIDRWLKAGTGDWDVIHFNFGLHDLKRVDFQTGKNSNDSDDPHQASPVEYEKQLREIVGKLKETGAKLIFATTTPVPPGSVKPHRDVEDPVLYNAIALKVMTENGIAVNDLFAYAEPRLDEIQRKANVHFTGEGYRELGEQVAAKIRTALTEPRE